MLLAGIYLFAVFFVVRFGQFIARAESAATRAIEAGQPPATITEGDQHGL